eukprot:RCo046132
MATSAYGKITLSVPVPGDFKGIAATGVHSDFTLEQSELFDTSVSFLSVRNDDYGSASTPLSERLDQFFQSLTLNQPCTSSKPASATPSEYKSAEPGFVANT